MNEQEDTQTIEKEAFDMLMRKAMIEAIQQLATYEARIRELETKVSELERGDR